MFLRFLTWNCRRASATSELWQYFEEFAPDVAMLQEVSSLPAHLESKYDVRLARPSTRDGGRQRFHSALLVRGRILESIELTSGIDWVDGELARFAGNLQAHRIEVGGWSPLIAVGVYSPPWSVPRQRLFGKRLDGVKLVQNPDVWLSDLLVAVLRNRMTDGMEWVVAGDFNACETFDLWKGGPRGNREWLDRMAKLGLVDCLRHAQGVLTPTFRRPGTINPSAQIDYLFVTKGLVAQLNDCRTGDREWVYGKRLSDHLPIVAEFGPMESRARGSDQGAPIPA